MNQTDIELYDSMSCPLGVRGLLYSHATRLIKPVDGRSFEPGFRLKNSSLKKNTTKGYVA